MLYRQFATQEEIDGQYNIELLVPDAKTYFEFFINESAKVRADLECVLDVPFGPTVEETLDIFPAEDADAPDPVVHSRRLLAAPELQGIQPRSARPGRTRDHHRSD